MARYDVKPGSTSSGVTVGGSSTMYVSSAGTAIETTISGNYYWGSMGILNGGEAIKTTIANNGSVEVANGGRIQKTNQIGGKQSILSGGITDNATITGGTLYLADGASATNLIINSNGGMIGDFSSASYITGTSNGKEIKISNGIMQNLTVYQSHYITVGERWVASSSILQGDYYKATMNILDGGIAIDTAMNKNSYIVVSNGGCIQKTKQITGTQNILSGGLTDKAVVTGGTLLLSAGASATDLLVSANGIMIGNFTSDSYISGTSQGKIVKLGNGVMQNLTVYQSRYMTLGDGWIASGTTLQGGYYFASMEINSGAKAINTILNSSCKLHVKSGGYAENTSQAAGSQIIYNGATASGGSVKGGTMYVANGGTVKGTELRTEGTIILSSGAKAYDLVLSNSNLGMSARAQLIRTSVCRGGKLAVSNSNVASDTQVLAGGTATIFNKAAASGGNVMSGGTLIFSSGAILTGTLNAAGTITVKNESGNTLGSLSIGGTLNAGGNSYTLTRNNAALSLTVTASGPSKSPAGDIDGNGVSDVMFQYKVDHQIGFWMNGSNTWKGQGLPEPAEWEVVGAYDMNANGKADVVMLGNVTVNGVKGAYVGYRKDGDMSTWENISYLNNPDNIQWNVKVGNMTGNAGKNSIVWHAAELGAVGVWTDGTDNWVSISGGFDKNWTMLGTGDFNGDGKDEILFRNGTNFYTTDINSNFSSLGGFGDGWDVRAIGDFSGDGKDDLVLFHKDTGSVVKLENGQTSSYASLGQLDANDWFIVGAGDYNGDGKDDLLVRQYSSGMLGYYANGDFSKWNEMGRGVDMNWAVIA